AESNLIPNLHVDGPELRITSKVDRVVREIDGDDRLGGSMPDFPGFMGEFWISYGGASDVFHPNAKEWIEKTAGGNQYAPDFKGITSLVSCDLAVDPLTNEPPPGPLPPETTLMGLG